MEDGVTEGQPSAPRTYADIFDEACPTYLAIGMTPEQYWDGESSLIGYYREAYRLRLEQREKEMDKQAWFYGLYVNRALNSTYLMVNGFVPKGAKAKPYPEKPLIEQQEEEKRQEEKQKLEERKQQTALAVFQAFVGKMNQNITKRLERDKAKK